MTRFTKRTMVLFKLSLIFNGVFSCNIPCCSYNHTCRREWKTLYRNATFLWEYTSWSGGFLCIATVVHLSQHFWKERKLLGTCDSCGRGEDGLWTAYHDLDLSDSIDDCRQNGEIWRWVDIDFLTWWKQTVAGCRVCEYSNNQGSLVYCWCPSKLKAWISWIKR